MLISLQIRVRPRKSAANLPLPHCVPTELQLLLL